jgi:hypothetical protein
LQLPISITLTVADAPQFIRTVTEVRPEWLIEYAPDYFDPSTFPENSETRRALQLVINKVSRAGVWAIASVSRSLELGNG